MLVASLSESDPKPSFRGETVCFSMTSAMITNRHFSGIDLGDVGGILLRLVLLPEPTIGRIVETPASGRMTAI